VQMSGPESSLPSSDPAPKRSDLSSSEGLTTETESSAETTMVEPHPRDEVTTAEGGKANVEIMRRRSIHYDDNESGGKEGFSRNESLPIYSGDLVSQTLVVNDPIYPINHRPSAIPLHPKSTFLVPESGLIHMAGSEINLTGGFGSNIISGEPIEPLWVVDSGATHHLTPHKSILLNVRSLTRPQRFGLADKSTVMIS
jgi:hypothetical protein